MAGDVQAREPKVNRDHAAHRSAAAPGPRSKAGQSLLELQRTAGNAAIGALLTGVQRSPFGSSGTAGGSGGRTPIATSDRQPIRTMATEKAERERRRNALSTALGFESQFQNPGPWANRMPHPMIQTFIRLIRAALIAKVVDKNDAVAKATGRAAYSRLVGLERTITILGASAPNRWGWQGEALVLGTLIGDLKNAAYRAENGAWHEGTESQAIRSLQLLHVGLAKVLAPSMTKTVSRRAGKNVDRKVYLGSVVTPVMVANFYLRVAVDKPDKKEGGDEDRSGSGGVKFDEHGEATGSLELKGEREGASISGSIERGPEGTIDPTFKAGSETGSIEYSKAGIKASAVAKMKDWDNKVEVSKEGITYSFKHSAGGGVSLSGSMDRMTLSATSPEIDIAGAKIQFEPIVEITPIPQVFRRTQTQNPEAVRAFQRACIAMLVISALPIAVGAGVAAGAAAIPVLVGVGEAVVGSELALAAGTALAGAAAR